ncbi:Na+/H+ antiporter [Knufia fluminis]|uniref:Na+/H+ antiporter n=1 Tax=Knufia fluminis TaxID=191047 RepID=A0AAN8F3F3_9EURO|nr:Na+/H+ antiporter [Knufia fluminis]
MAWDQLSINKPHLVYIILGGFTSIFMLMSLFIKEKLYIGEATVATICGLIFGPHAANLINPLTWGNTDQITLEFSRIVLVVQCFAIGVELPKSYMERHWLSVVCLLIPVMTFGWLMTSLFVWWMIVPLTWLESLCVAACVTATDPVLASSVVGKGKFAKRVPKHIRDLLSAESGCNDGMAFPFVYLALDLIHYHLDAKHVVQHWFVNTILYECIWGATYGVLVGYIARHAIKLAEKRGIIDRESFLVFYFVLALFCAGSGSLLGMDDLLVGFAAGVGFSNDGWFTEKTEESHVSNVIDLLLNLTYFVYLGTIIPWEQFNSGLHGLDAWRLVVIAILVLFFRRIPIMLMLKPIIPDIKTWREALFCGHFGPIGVGAIFVAILARAELETSTTTPLAVLPPPDDAEYVLIYTIWPITTFLVITSIMVHGSSIAVFTLGKRINTLTMTLSYTQGNENGSNWMDRLPRIASRSKSQGKSFNSDYSEDEKLDVPPGQLPPTGLPKLHLRRQKEDDEKGYLRPDSRSRSKRRKRKSGLGAGGPISDSAIMPHRSSEPALRRELSGSDTAHDKYERPSLERATSDRLEGLRSDESDSEDDLRKREAQKEQGKRARAEEPQDNNNVDVEAFEEVNHLIVEDEEGNVLESTDTHGKTEEEKASIIEQTRSRLGQDSSGKYSKHKHVPHEKTEGEEVENETMDAVAHPQKHFRGAFKGWKGFGKSGQAEQGGPSKKPAERKRGPAHAYQFGSTIIVEDEDGEVIHKYDIPKGEQQPNKYNGYMRQGVQRMGTWVGRNRAQPQTAVSTTEPREKVDDGEDTSTTSPEKDVQEGEPEKSVLPDSRPKKPQRGNTKTAGDDGLRMVISNTEQYGLTGLRKQRPGDRPGMVEAGGGRRMSTQDFVRHMQELDKKTRQKEMNEAGVDTDVQEAINRGALARRGLETSSDRPKPANRAGTAPLSKYKSPIQERHGEEEEEEAKDYFSAKQAPPRGAEARKRAHSDAMISTRPEPQRTQTEQSTATNDEDEEDDIPTHDVRNTLARHGNTTAADARRQRHRPSAQAEEPIDEGDDEDDPTAETAAEKRRRLAALGLGGGESESESDDEGPRVQKKAVQEPGVEDAAAQPPSSQREKPAEAPRMRIQWGGETREGDDVEAQVGEGSEQKGSGGVGRRLKGFLNR